MKRLLPLFTVLFVLSIFTIENADAQRYRRWNRYKKEFGINFGGTLLMGDLGNSDKLRGLNLKNSGMTYGGFFKYRFHDRFTAKGNLMFGNFYASDGNSPEGYKEKHGIRRNLNAKTRFTEVSGQVEYYIFQEKIGSRYKVRGVKGYGQSSFALYVFAGLGANIFNPKGKLPSSGEFISLKDLNTEGQTLPNGPSDYSTVTMIFPFGAGLKYNFNRQWGVQAEASYRFTTTDYLDDVSEYYYDGDELAANFGELSKLMAEKGHGSAATGDRRGGPAKDLYLTGTISITYRLKSKARSRVRL